MRPTPDQIFAALQELVYSKNALVGSDADRKGRIKRHDNAWKAAREVVRLAGVPPSEHDKVRAELLAMPSVQHVDAAAVAVHKFLHELGMTRRFESLTLSEVESIAHKALFTKDPGSPFARAKEE